MKTMGFVKTSIARVLNLPEPCVRAMHRKGWNTHKFFCRIVDGFLFPRDFALAVALGREDGHPLPNLFHPRNFNEATLSRMLFDRKWKYMVWSDKLEVRNYVEKRIGNKYLVPLLWAGNDLTHAKEVNLPNRFIIKANHGSGTNLIVRNLSSFDWDLARRQTQAWLMEDYSAKFGEWQYRWMSRRLLIEQFLEQPDGLLLDYKIHVFHGTPLFVQVIDRVGTHCECGYDPKWKNLGWALTYPVLKKPIPKPPELNEMLEIAHILSENTPYVRVDLYDVSGRIYFGELTLHPGAASLHGGGECERAMFDALRKKTNPKA